MEAEMEAAKKVGTGGEEERTDTHEEPCPPYSSVVARQRIDLLCLPFLCVTAGSAGLQLLTMIILNTTTCITWYPSIHSVVETSMVLDWTIGLVVILIILMVPSVLLAAFTFRRKTLGTYYTEKFQLFHTILLGLAASSFLAELILMIWLACDLFGPPFGNSGCEALSTSIFFNAIIVIVECGRSVAAGVIFHHGKMI